MGCSIFDPHPASFLTYQGDRGRNFRAQLTSFSAAMMQAQRGCHVEIRHWNCRHCSCDLSLERSARQRRRRRSRRRRPWWRRPWWGSWRGSWRRSLWRSFRGRPFRWTPGWREVRVLARWLSRPFLRPPRRRELRHGPQCPRSISNHPQRDELPVAHRRMA